MEWNFDMEAAPKDGTWILVYGDPHHADSAPWAVAQWADMSYEEEVLVGTRGSKRTYETRRVESGYWDCDVYPRAWQPLPSPPERSET